MKCKIETNPLLGVCAGLFLASLPLIRSVAPWTTAIFIGAILMRLLANRLHLGLPGPPVKLFILFMSVIGMLLTYGTLVGVAPGLGILLILIALKLVESNSEGDFQVLTLLGWFLNLCILFFSQDLKTWLYVGAISFVLIASLIRFHSRSGASGSFWHAARLAVTLLLQAAPLIFLLFLFFPRTQGGLNFNFTRAVGNTHGMSDEMEPGSVSSLVMSSNPAFRVDFPDHNLPSPKKLFWRGGVLWHGDGLTWARGNLPRTESPGYAPRESDIRQRIILEPHSGRWIFALDNPVSATPVMNFEPGNYLQSPKAIHSSFRYEVRSRPETPDREISPNQRREASQRPSKISSRVQALVDSWRRKARTPRDLADQALNYFNSENFVYTLNPGLYEGDTLEEFLFNGRRGFCEHYAGAFASLMRIGGVPSRVVIGYHGGDFNRLGNYVIVRQSDAHAWCEVWLEESGWTRIDPVSAIAPERVETQTSPDAFRENDPSSAAGIMVHTLNLEALSRTVQLAWDSLNFQWDLRVLSFDQENQQSLFSYVGLQDRVWSTLILGCLLTATLLLILIAFWLKRPKRLKMDPITREYAHFCQLLARAGLPRAPHEGPMDFIERAAEHFPAKAAMLREIGELYVRLRYTKEPPAIADFLRQVQYLKRNKMEALPPSH